MNLKSLIPYYRKHYAPLAQAETPAEAERLVGGDFHTVGTIEYSLLKSIGLTPEMRVVDVGCGTGRLAYQLANRGHLHYAGFDIAEAPIAHARSLCRRPDWTFALSDGLKIGLPDASVDLICFFSVFTHIANEHAYLYLQESARLLRPGGRIVFSFLEFRIYSHWSQFEIAFQQFGQDLEPIVFLDRAGIDHMAANLGFAVETYLDGDQANIPIEEELTWVHGAVMKDKAALGQSACVLRKPLPQAHSK